MLSEVVILQYPTLSIAKIKNQMLRVEVMMWAVNCRWLSECTNTRFGERECNFRSQRVPSIFT